MFLKLALEKIFDLGRERPNFLLSWRKRPNWLGCLNHFDILFTGGKETLIAPSAEKEKNVMKSTESPREIPEFRAN